MHRISDPAPSASLVSTATPARISACAGRLLRLRLSLRRVLLAGSGLISAFSSPGRAAEPVPFWDSREMSGDPLFFVQPAEGVPPSARLLLIPEKLPVLKSATLQVTYEAGRDFTWEAGSREIRLPEGSRIPFKTVAQLHPAPQSPNSYSACRDGKSWMLFGEGRFFHDQQAVAGYTSAESWTGPAARPGAEEPLRQVRAKLQAGQPIRLVTLGDSISTGANASASAGAPPMQPGYPDLVAHGLEARFGSRVTAVNLSVGGMNAPWGISRIPAVLAERPDLLLCAFGMNDASGGTAPDAFAAQIREIVTRVRTARPSCDVVVISPMTANPGWTHSAPELYPAYARMLAEIPGCALADVTPVWTAVVDRKSVLSLSGNGLNHPNDFGHRLYADVVLSVIGPRTEAAQSAK